MCKSLQQQFQKRDLIIDTWQIESNWKTPCRQLYITFNQTRPPWASAPRPVGLQTACSLWRDLHPAASALLHPHTHPFFPTGPSKPSSPPPPLPHLPTSLLACLPSLYWAHEGEAVPSGTTVQIAVLPPQMEATLLWIPLERVGALLSSTFCLVVVVSNHTACPRLSLTVDTQGSGMHCAAISKSYRKK